MEAYGNAMTHALKPLIANKLLELVEKVNITGYISIACAGLLLPFLKRYASLPAGHRGQTSSTASRTQQRS